MQQTIEKGLWNNTMGNLRESVKAGPTIRQGCHRKLVNTGKTRRIIQSIIILVLALAAQPILAAGPHNDGAAEIDSEMLNMSLEDLLDVQVTSVSKRPQSLSDAAAAVFVISNEDLRRSGVTSIPEALRMVPGIDVARIDANKWAVTSRGFNGRFANKLLVLMDGRTIYSPTFSGVYWESQDVILEDVERIEVIRGPGATLWGANAVNGVVNIITRHAADTQGGLGVLGAGTEERGFATARYGARLGEGTYGRVYAKGLKRDEFSNPNGDNAGDDWKALRAGFRLDSQITKRDNLSIQGDIHREDIHQTIQLATIQPPYTTLIDDDVKVSAGHLILRWEHTPSAVSKWSLQAYYDRFDRDEETMREQRDTFDLDLTHHRTFESGHDVVWGLGYRYTRDEFENSSTIYVDPDSRGDQLFSAFLQDEITLVPEKLRLTLGSKFEYNDYTGFEVQPSARLAWVVNSKNRIWGSVSRSVRTPSRVEHDFRISSLVAPPFSGENPSPLPLEAVAVGNAEMDSETLIAYELGYRTAPLNNLTVDVALFYNDYDDLRIFDSKTPLLANPPTHLVLPALFTNGAQGKTYGAELATAWMATKGMRFDLAYSYTESNIDWIRSLDISQNTAAPRHKLSLRSSFDVRPNIDLDIWFRYVGKTEVYNHTISSEAISIDAYPNLDIRLAWRPAKSLELSLVGQNLLDNRHLEYIQELFTLPTEVQRGVYGQLEWKF